MVTTQIAGVVSQKTGLTPAPIDRSAARAGLVAPSEYPPRPGLLGDHFWPAAGGGGVLTCCLK
jgi:hypothetical protein